MNSNQHESIWKQLILMADGRRVTMRYHEDMKTRLNQVTKFTTHTIIAQPFVIVCSLFLSFCFTLPFEMLMPSMVSYYRLVSLCILDLYIEIECAQCNAMHTSLGLLNEWIIQAKNVMHLNVLLSLYICVCVSIKKCTLWAKTLEYDFLCVSFGV